MPRMVNPPPLWASKIPVPYALVVEFPLPLFLSHLLRFMPPMPEVEPLPPRNALPNMDPPLPAMPPRPPSAGGLFTGSSLPRHDGPSEGAGAWEEAGRRSTVMRLEKKGGWTWS